MSCTNKELLNIDLINTYNWTFPRNMVGRGFSLCTYERDNRMTNPLKEMNKYTTYQWVALNKSEIINLRIRGNHLNVSL